MPAAHITHACFIRQGLGEFGRAPASASELQYLSVADKGRNKAVLFDNVYAQ